MGLWTILSSSKKLQQMMEDALATAVPYPLVAKDVINKEKKQGRPIPLTTVALLKACRTLANRRKIVFEWITDRIDSLSKII